MNYLETICTFLLRLARILFGRRTKKQPAQNVPVAVPCPDRPALPSDEGAGSDSDGYRRYPGPVESEKGEPYVTTENAGALNLVGWCLMITGGLSWWLK